MTSRIDDVLVAISASLALAIVLKVTIVTTVALAAVRATRRGRAAVRHLVLLAAFGVLLALPIAAALTPAMTIPLPTTSPVVEPMIGSDVPSPRAAASSTVNTDVIITQTSARWPVPTPSTVLLAIWAVAATAFLLPMAIGLWQLRSLRRAGLPWQRGRVLIESLRLDARLRRRVDVLLHEDVPGPMTCGVWRPTIILPRDAETWAHEDLHRAIVHELEHVRRGDWISQCLARVVSAAYWFHPLVWIAWRHLALEAERACDDAVLLTSLEAGSLTGLRMGPDPSTAYADQLVALAGRLSASAKSPVLAMANRHDLATRVTAVLDRRQRRGRAGARLVATMGAAAAMAVAAVSPLRMIAADSVGIVSSNGVQASGPTIPKFDVVSIKPCDPNSDSSGQRGGGGNTSPVGRLDLPCMPLEHWIEVAYVQYPNGVRLPELSFLPLPIDGAPSWVKSDAYKITAEISGDPSPLMMRGPMLQALLEDQFKLKLHRDTREVAVHELTIAKGGLKLQRTVEGSCTERDLTQPSPPGPIESRHDCLISRRRGPAAASNWVVDVHGRTLPQFANYLDNLVSGPVLDRTGIPADEKFDLHLEFVADDTMPGLLNATVPPSMEVGSEFPSLADALGKVGVRYVATKGPGTFLIVDHVERPVPNDAAPQTPASAVRFEAATIKPCNSALGPSGTAGRRINTSANRVDLECLTLDSLINLAFLRQGGFKLVEADIERQVRGGPDWMRSTRYTINAVAPGTPDAAVMFGPMLRTFLEETLHLRTHAGVDQVPMYALTVSKGGLKIAPITDGACVDDDTGAGASTPASVASGRAGAGSKPVCGQVSGHKQNSIRTWDLGGATLDELAGVLETDREVVDRTGVSGRFDIHLRYTLDAAMPAAARDDHDLPVDRTGAAGAGVFSAVDEQLGLKLVSIKGPHEYVVVDHIERPTTR